MFICHYNNDFLSCSYECFDALLHTTKFLFRIYNKNIIEADIIEAFYQNDNIFYAGKMLFESERMLYDLQKNYCNLAKLIFIFYTGINDEKLNNIVLNMYNIPITIEPTYDEFY